VISGLAAAVTGRRGRWLTIAIWIVVGVGGWIARSHIGGIAAAGQASFLPRHSEATRAQEALQRGRGGGSGGRGSSAQEVPAVILFDREGGLTQRDLRAIGRLGVGLNRLDVTGATPVIDAFTADSSESLGDFAKNVRG
jgi:RND superfamily putative drug exporter